MSKREEAAMSTLTRADVVELIGDASDHLIARVMATGATPEELAEAAREMELGAGERRIADTGRVSELCEILREELDEDIWPEQ
jgi:hypothetical protein